MCRKVKFGWVEASLALIDAKRSRSKRRRECRLYHCEECSAWHLTSLTSYSSSVIFPTSNLTGGSDETEK